jgi:exodeoxyribonuclease V gamma subunit
MAKQFDVFLSNRLDVLYQDFKKSLFAESAPFLRRLVVVYGPAMKMWLMKKMAEDPELGIAAGIEIIYLHEAFQKLMEGKERSSSHLPNLLELALAIEKEMILILKGFEYLTESEQEDWQPLLEYLKIEREWLSYIPFRLSRKIERRLIGLSQELAKLFNEYGKCGKTIVSEWEKPLHRGWQQALWRRLFKSQMGWSYPALEFEKPFAFSSHIRLFFFSISFITRPEFEFLSRLSTQVPIYYYLLSPCAVFWSDIRSDKESAYLLSYWQKRIGGTNNQVLALEELLRDRNPLLANFGRLGREMASQIEESLAQTHAYYVLPEQVKSLVQDFFSEDLHFEEKGQPFNLLKAIQSDMLLMRNPHEEEALSLSIEDDSIQIHMAPTKKREVQILYHTLMKLIENHSPHLCPNDILVMVPNIADYVPYIQSVFGSAESQLDFQLLDLGMQFQNEIVQGLLLLFALSESRWDVSHVLQLFEHKAFQRRHQLTAGDYQLIQMWVEKVGIRWGEDIEHRNELLQRHHCEQGLVEESNTGTWDHGLTRLLLGLTALSQDAVTLPFETIPSDHVDFSQSDLLGRWIRLLYSLRDDLAPLHDGTRLTVEDWSNYFSCLLEHYFRPDLNDPDSVQSYDDLQAQFDYLRTSSRHFPNVLFSFQSVKAHLMSLLQHKSLTFRENYLQTIRFFSMLPLRSIPAKVVALMGMQEDAFPRAGHHSSLNLVAGKEGSDYFPSTTDCDRYLFLEALQSATEHLIISYQGYSHTDGKELQPSLVIEELVSYLDRHYRIGNQLFSQSRIFKHPFDAFHEAYFHPSSHLRSYSPADFRAALAYYNKEKRPAHCFVKNFTVTSEPTPSLSRKYLIDLRHLIDVARNPIKFHLNHVLDIYLEKEEDRKVKDEEDFQLSQLDRYMLRQEALKEPLEKILQRAEQEGKLPAGLFKQVASLRLQEEVQHLQERLQKHQIKSEQIFQIEFSAGCSSPKLLEQGHWLLPSPVIRYPDGRSVQIVGKLPHVTPKGLLAMSKGSLSDSWKAWPQFLLYNYAANLHPDGLEKQLIPLQAASPKKAFFENPEMHLRKFLDYYQLCQKNFSPLMPDWFPLIVQGDVKGLEGKLKQVFTDSFTEHQHHDLRWVLNKDHLPCPNEIVEQWQATAKELMQDLLHHWHTKDKEEQE